MNSARPRPCIEQRVDVAHRKTMGDPPSAIASLEVVEVPTCEHFDRRSLSVRGGALVEREDVALDMGPIVVDPFDDDVVHGVVRRGPVVARS